MLRSVAKAVIIQDGKILLQKCMDTDGIVYYELPGGGQEPLETMEEAVIRECLEETGYQVVVDRFLALQEEIMTNPVVREAYPEHAHRVFHVFLCHILGDVGPAIPRDADLYQVGIEWMALDTLPQLTVRPKIVRLRLHELLASGKIGYMKANRIDTFFPGV